MYLHLCVCACQNTCVYVDIAWCIIVLCLVPREEKVLRTEGSELTELTGQSSGLSEEEG